MIMAKNYETVCTDPNNFSCVKVSNLQTNNRQPIAFISRFGKSFVVRTAL